MHTLQEIVDEVAAQDTTIKGLGVFIKGLEDQISGVGLTPTQQAAVDALFNHIDANTQLIAVAMAPAVVAPPPIVIPPVAV